MNRMGSVTAQLSNRLISEENAKEWDQIVEKHIEKKEKQKEKQPISLLEANEILTSKIKEEQEKIFSEEFNSGSSGIYNLSERESSHSFASHITKRKIMEKRRQGMLLPQ